MRQKIKINKQNTEKRTRIINKKVEEENIKEKVKKKKNKGKEEDVARRRLPCDREGGRGVKWSVAMTTQVSCCHSL